MRSCLNGNDLIYRPIRLHSISSVIKKNIKNKWMQMSSSVRKDGVKSEIYLYIYIYMFLCQLFFSLPIKNINISDE